MTGSDRSHSMSSSAQGVGSASTGASSLQRVTRDSLDQQLTAKALIGKNVHDSAGEKIGEVQDIVLDSSRLPELASAFVNRENNRNTASAGATGARGTDTYAAGAAGDGASTSATRTSRDSQLSDLGNQARSMVQGAISSGPAAIVSSGGVMGIGGDLIRVPLSQLRYDAAEDRVTLDVSREQISRITETDASDTSRSAAE
jgi:PRC-barrel domain.